MVIDRVLYWDASAVLSLLLPDTHTETARAHASTERAHIVSSLTNAQVYAVLSKLERIRAIDSERAASARQRFFRGLWSSVSVDPSRALVQRLAQRWKLKGADLWHLGAATALRVESPLELLSFNRMLVEAARGEGFSAT